MFERMLVPGIMSGLISWGVTWVVIKLAAPLGLVDDPRLHKHVKVTHSYPVARGGGIPIFIALVTTAVWFLPMDRHLAGIIVGAAVVLTVGLWDDRKEISPYWRLVFNGLAAAAVVSVGIGIAFVTNPLGEGIIDLSWPRWNFFWLGEWRSIWILADMFALLWIVGLMNSVGMGAGGIEGQFPGVVAIAAGVIGILSLRFSSDISQWPVMTLAGITSGAYLGFLWWNFYPQKIMPGYSGKSLGGYLLAVMAILSTTKVGTALVVLGVPIMDVSWAVIRRIKIRKSPVWGDRGHLHHKLLDSGWGKRRIAIFYWLITAGLGGLALSLNSEQKLYVIVGVGVLTGMGLLFLSNRLKN